MDNKDEIRSQYTEPKKVLPKPLYLLRAKLWTISGLVTAASGILCVTLKSPAPLILLLCSALLWGKGYVLLFEYLGGKIVCERMTCQEINKLYIRDKTRVIMSDESGATKTFLVGSVRLAKTFTVGKEYKMYYKVISPDIPLAYEVFHKNDN